MTYYSFDNTLDGLLTAVFDAFARREQPEALLKEGDQMPLFGDEVHAVQSDTEKAGRVWAGLEKRLSKEAVKVVAVSWLSELPELNGPLFRYICKVFQQPENSGKAYSHNFADPDVLAVTNIARKVMHERLRMMQFVRFQKAKDGTYLAVVAPDHNVLPLVTDHFADRFNDQPWLIYDAKRHYGYYYDGSGQPVRITFADESSVAFNLANGRLNDDVLSDEDQLLQEMWRTYFKAICIKERLNPRKQLNDMPRRYWKYMTEKQSHRNK